MGYIAFRLYREPLAKLKFFKRLIILRFFWDLVNIFLMEFCENRYKTMIIPLAACFCTFPRKKTPMKNSLLILLAIVIRHILYKIQKLPANGLMKPGQANAFTTDLGNLENLVKILIQDNVTN